jgi:hypothetical protein
MTMHCPLRGQVRVKGSPPHPALAASNPCPLYLRFQASHGLCAVHTDVHHACPGEMVPTLAIGVSSDAASEAMVSLLVIIAWCRSIDDA